MTDLVGVHVQGVDTEVVRRQIQRFEHLSQGQIFAVSVNDDLLRIVSTPLR